MDDKQSKLYQFPRGDWGIANESPFCMKLECFLRMVNIPYDIVEIANPKKAPHGKVPFFVYEGKELLDSGYIIDYLNKSLNHPLDSHLSNEELQIARLTQRSLEEHLYWGIVHSRWIDDKGFKLFTEPYQALFPFPLNRIITRLIRREVAKELWYQGLGRHDVKKMYALCVEDLEAVVALLADKPFFFGEKPSTIDACIYAHFAAILYQPWDTPLYAYLSQQKNAIAYCERMQQKYFPDIKPKS